MKLAAIVRSAALYVSAATLVVISLTALVSPDLVARSYGLHLAHETMSEFRAVFVGGFLGQAVVMALAARRRDVPLLGDACGVLILAQALGRALSFGLDGTLEPRFVLAFAAELAAGLAVVFTRPRAAQ